MPGALVRLPDDHMPASLMNAGEVIDFHILRTVLGDLKYASRRQQLGISFQDDAKEPVMVDFFAFRSTVLISRLQLLRWDFLSKPLETPIDDITVHTQLSEAVITLQRYPFSTLDFD